MTVKHIFLTEDPAQRRKRQAALHRKCLLWLQAKRAKR